MDERMPLTSEPKTRAEYRAAIRDMQEEIRRLFGEMDENHAQFERNQARIEAAGAQTDAILRDLQNQLERLRRAGQPDAERAV